VGLILGISPGCSNITQEIIKASAFWVILAVHLLTSKSMEGVLVTTYQHVLGGTSELGSRQQWEFWWGAMAFWRSWQVRVDRSGFVFEFWWQGLGMEWQVWIFS
jgi:hypothetical protein